MCLSWLVFALMMSTAGGIGLGILGSDEAPARPTVTATNMSHVPDGEPAANAVVLAAIEMAVLAAPANGIEDRRLPPHAGKAHAPGNTSAADWRSGGAKQAIHAAWMSARPVVRDLAAAMVTVSRAWAEQYDEAAEPHPEQNQQALIHPDPVPALPGQGGLPVIAIVIDDLGLNRRQTAAVVDLPAPLTMAFIPYAEDLAGQTQAAHANGHEIFLHLPMEPIDPSKDPGPNALLASLSPGELSARLVENLDRFSGYVGVNNHMGSRLTQDSEAMTLVMAELKRRDLLFLDSMTIGNSVAHNTAERLGVPSAKRDVFLDNEPEVAAILGQLSALEAVASRHGYAIAIGHPYGATVTALAQWIPDALARGYQIVPASEIIDRRAMIVAQYSEMAPAP